MWRSDLRYGVSLGVMLLGSVTMVSLNLLIYNDSRPNEYIAQTNDLPWWSCDRSLIYAHELPKVSGDIIFTIAPKYLIPRATSCNLYDAPYATLDMLRGALSEMQLINWNADLFHVNPTSTNKLTLLLLAYKDCVGRRIQLVNLSSTIDVYVVPYEFYDGSILSTASLLGGSATTYGSGNSWAISEAVCKAGKTTTFQLLSTNGTTSTWVAF